MSGYRVTHDLDEDPTVYDGQVLGDDSPLEFEDGEAVVDDEETARDLVRRHTHIELGGPVAGAEEASEPAVESPPFDPAEKTVSELEDALEDEDYDWNDAALRGLREAEADGENRETALEAIDAQLGS